MSTSGELKVTRIKAGIRQQMDFATDGLKLAQEHVAKEKAMRDGLVEYRNMQQTLSQLGKYSRADGFDPTRQFQHVARVSEATWALILGMFARYDEASGELMDDGQLYKTIDGRLQLNKPFFYAVIEMLEQSGVPCDLRGKIKLN